ncbi:hypothetical protein PGTUg99_010079 [Puccinia graminis f. sp. tritici]|uniref:Uncharacterized protein n=1 Tax=Puccinia graminis f. sp. tritici TaxID=56615 RepID=A0A5B0R5W1_PUCGR|nr:hypothetical protein PGTUg99_010079 [Puccinia graminis f. sp. tritici]
MADHQSRLAGWSTAHGYEPTALPAMPTKIDALHITFWGHSDINEEKIKQIKVETITRKRCQLEV